MSLKRKIRYLYRWDLIPQLRLYDKFLRYIRSLPDRRYWKSLKNKHKGKAGFVIGNGPSLKIEDLTMIKEGDFVSIASNKVYLAFEKTDWRPNYFTVADTLVWDKIKKEIHADIKTVHIPSYLTKKSCNVDSKYWRALRNDYEINLKNISKDISIGAYCGSTITYQNIQIAIHLGLNPIYLVGCDHSYAGEKNIIADKAIKQSEHKTHFVEGYRKTGELVLPASIEKMTASYKIAKLFADKNNIRIFNATRGGYLEVFDRIDISDIFNMSMKKNKSKEL